MIGEVESHRLKISQSILQEMMNCARNAYPEETCGLLGGVNHEICIHIPVENSLHSPVRFRMDPRQQLIAFQRLDALGWDLLAIWHSHPTGPDAPSAMDAAEFLYPGVQTVILSAMGEDWQVRAFIIKMGRVLPVDFKIQ